MYQSLNDVQKSRIFNVIFLTILLLAVFLGVKVLNGLKENKYIGSGVYPSNVIAVSGSGEVFAVPDTASFSFSVVEEGKTVKEAQDKATKKMNSVLDAIKGMGIEEKDIKTVGYNSYPKYDYTVSTACAPYGYCPPGKQVITGYEVSQSVSVKIRDTEKAGDVLTKAGSFSVSNMSNLDFVIDDMDKINDEAREKAIEDAKEKAKVLSKSLGVRLKKIVSFNEGGGYPSPIYYARDMSKDAYGMGGTEAAQVAPSLPVGENKYISSVTITYEVE
ncbi:MAG TPA: SIMPL domain-containing protein [Candidatus Paceibacterota bacterium]